MKKKLEHITFAFFCLCLFNACSKDKEFDCLKSTGKITMQDRYFQNFNTIIVEDNINLVLMQSLPGKVIIEAGENLEYKIDCKQNGNVLTVQNKNTCNWVRKFDIPVNVYVGVDQIKNISQNGYGTISAGEYIKTDTIQIFNLSYGSTNLSIDAAFVGFIADNYSTFTLSGKANKVAGRCFQNASTDTRNMKAAWVYMINTSLLDAKIYCDSLLQTDIEGNGSIICIGNPGIIQPKHPSGNGSLQFQ
ncbi:MAG TPA: DUF2807 domain-containing protein [Cytophagaceae bacterium]|jgi:hypothetical protein|nr:DUF2807 domain-containing protein [Cytophagaceae bacterium]